MPNSFLVVPKISRKSLKLTTLLLLSPLFFLGQSLTGLWVGALSNDSSTARKDQSFEIVLTESLGKVFGFSRNEFIVDDTLYYVLKKVRGTIKGDICEVVDEEIVSYNFPGRLDKGIKVTSTFSRNKKDSTWNLDGSWKTNATKKYYAVTGKVNLSEEKDLTASKIFPHLEEVNMANDVAFYRDRKEGTPIVRIVKPEKIKTEYSSKIDLIRDSKEVIVSLTTPDMERAETIPPVVAVSKSTIDIQKTDTKLIVAGPVDITPVAVTRTIAENKIPEQEIVAVVKPSLELPKTDTKNIPATSINLSPELANKTIAENNIPEQEIVAVIKPSLKLSKTDTKNIPATSVNLLPAITNKTIAENKIPEQEIVAVVKPSMELSKTDTKNIPATSVNLTPPIANKRIAQNKIPDVTKTTGKTISENLINEKVSKVDPIAKTGSLKEIESVETNNKVTNTINPLSENKIGKTEPVAKNIVKQESVIQKQTDNNPIKNQDDKRNIVKTNSSVTAVSTNPATGSKTPALVSTINDVKITTTAEKKEVNTAPVAAISPEEKKPAVDLIAKFALVGGRKTEFSQIVSFKSDSLELSLYDNGEIDGDTVSVFMNGEMFMSKQGLKASAIKKTIYITKSNEDFTLLLFAENLGKYPPNTGLLVVHDGDDVYNLRFNSDFQKNTGIVFRRKR